MGSQGPLKAKPRLLSSDQGLSHGVRARPSNLCRKPEGTPSLLRTKPLTSYILTSNSNSMEERKKEVEREGGREGGGEGEREERGRGPLRPPCPRSAPGRTLPARSLHTDHQLPCTQRFSPQHPHGGVPGPPSLLGAVKFPFACGEVPLGSRELETP